MTEVPFFLGQLRSVEAYFWWRLKLQQKQLRFGYDFNSAIHITHGHLFIRARVYHNHIVS
jgi:hypothetical protein